MDDLEARRRADARHHENKPRLAFAFGEYESTGIGSEQFTKATEFGATFTERPFVAVGAQIDADSIAEAFDLDPDADVPLPHVTAYVTEWNRDERGFYTGAWCACTVTFPAEVLVAPGDPPTAIPLPDDLVVKVQHHFTFSGIAMKDVPIDQTL